MSETRRNVIRGLAVAPVVVNNPPAERQQSDSELITGLIWLESRRDFVWFAHHRITEDWRGFGTTEMGAIADLFAREDERARNERPLF